MDGQLVRLESGRSRRELIRHLVELAREDRSTIVGLDFAFSFPAWFLGGRGIGTARELWERVREEGEGWLERREPPFWGWPGSRKPRVPDHFRVTEREAASVAGSQPKSTLHVQGAGTVGTGSLRGMPYLLELSDGGYSIWPFERPQLPVVIEIYPRLLTGDVRKSSSEEREAYLDQEYPGLKAELRAAAIASDDAFDAAVSALVMARHADQLRRLNQPRNATARLEGAIWWPGWEDAFGNGGRSVLLQQALVYAASLHADQRRKGPGGAPYISHLLGVCSLVLEAGGDEEQAVAALLHDAPEDQGGLLQLEEIRQRFGDRVAGIVEACSDTLETPKPPWRPRKEAYVRHLRSGSADGLLVACADKLYNARSILRDFRQLGPAVFERFNASREETLWYYGAVAEALQESELKSWLVEELADVVQELRRSAS